MPHTEPTALARRIDRFREAAHAEPRLDGVLLYGSWTLGEADAYSDVEAYLFVRDADVADFDGVEFAARLGPVAYSYENQFGVLTVVFDDLMRGEFHVTASGAGVEQVRGWRGMIHLPDTERAVVLDRDGRLTSAARTLAEFQPPEPVGTASHLVGELTNWTLMEAHLLARGETARAHAWAQFMVAPAQLKLCRLLRDSTRHWLTPSRAVEQDLPAADVERYRATTSAAEPASVLAAAVRSWRWTRELAAEAEARWSISVPTELHGRIAALLADLEAGAGWPGPAVG
ncbi:DNA polymerase subunit beta [Actinoalloteichus sp. AHMU CJ021]|uniref:DNA polymerase subunit beta n=1 Tax=Actinoalloteichus sp. AHMU CJ021 TaxID=2072503 RepID=UPI000CA01875|nr:DNA polymerase subunit beta [Actinoalloteichus sp. AHMU CJ021]